MDKSIYKFTKYDQAGLQSAKRYIENRGCANHVYCKNCPLSVHYSLCKGSFDLCEYIGNHFKSYTDQEIEILKIYIEDCNLRNIK